MRAVLPCLIILKKERIDMKRVIKAALGLGAAGITAGAVAYGGCTLIDELLFNRNMVLPEKIGQKISGCDSSHLGGFLQNNLKWLEDYGYERHYIISDSGYKLTGYLLKAKEESKVYLFGAHGYRSYGKKEFCGVAQYYIKKGINVFIPDHVASGESEGTHCTFGYNEVRDCMKWLSYMTDNFGADIQIILHGVSMGCATVTMMSGREDLPDNVKMTVADCGFTTAKALFEYKLKDLGVPPERLINSVDRVHKRRQGFSFDDLKPVEAVKKASVPMLFIHGAEDKLVPCFMVKELYEACGSEHKDLLIVEGADHAQSYKVDKEQFEARLDALLKAINK